MSSSATSPDLICLAAIRGARASFFGEVEAHAARSAGLEAAAEIDHEHRKVLRSEVVGHIAEFFYILKYGGLKIPGDLRGFLDRHNADMNRLLESCHNGYAEGGLSAQRLKRAIFTPAQIDYVLHESASGEVRFDQQSLQRVFSQSMSFESCRTSLVLLARYGFLRRWEFNQVIVGSRGVLEDLYRTHLNTIVDGVRDALSGN